MFWASLLTLPRPDLYRNKETRFETEKVRISLKTSSHAIQLTSTFNHVEPIAHAKPEANIACDRQDGPSSVEASDQTILYDLGIKYVLRVSGDAVIAQAPRGHSETSPLCA